MEAKLDGKLPRKLHRLVRVTPQIQHPLSPYGEVGVCRPGGKRQKHQTYR